MVIDVHHWFVAGGTFKEKLECLCEGESLAAGRLAGVEREKIQQLHRYYDRLSMSKQVAKGWFERMIVGTIVNRWKKGLH